jgi:hypothetical protein
MIKILIIPILMSIFLNAMNRGYWHYSKEDIQLKKDEYFSLKLTQNKTSKMLHIKWTLYVADNLTMILNYDNFNYHTILDKQNNSFKLYLFKKKSTNIQKPYMIIKFLNFNKYNHLCKFEILIRDENKNLIIKSIKK